MIRIRPFTDPDEPIVLSWCRDENTFFNWTAGVLGDYPLTGDKFGKTGALMRFTALEDNEPVGFFTARNPNGTPDELRFGFVIVDPDRRRGGIGKEMLRLGLDFAFRIYKTEKVTLGVFENNTPALACYSSAGFHMTDRKEEYALNGEKRIAVDMERLRCEG